MKTDIKARFILPLTILLLLITSGAYSRFIPEPDIPPDTRRVLRWDEQAEKDLGLPRGMGKRLMTRPEWQEYRNRLQNLMPAEREALRSGFPEALYRRARERGIDLPGKGSRKKPEPPRPRDNRKD